METKSRSETEKKIGKLYIVSTPIGNYDDFTLRAIKVLKACDVVVCEEMKIGARTLRRLNLSKTLDSLNEQNEHEKADDLIRQLKEGSKLALISDDGTPVFADPGLILVRKALENNIQIEVVPGVTCIMTALVRSGFSIEQFLYAGFLNRQKEIRLEQLKRLSTQPRTVVFLDTPYRLMPVLEACSSVMPNRPAYIGANLTMPYETHHYGTFSELFVKFSAESFKGEYVICFEGANIDFYKHQQPRRSHKSFSNKKKPRRL